LDSVRILLRVPGGQLGCSCRRAAAPPHRRTAAPPHRRTAAPPHRRTAAPPHHLMVETTNHLSDATEPLLASETVRTYLDIVMSTADATGDSAPDALTAARTNAIKCLVNVQVTNNSAGFTRGSACASAVWPRSHHCNPPLHSLAFAQTTTQNMHAAIRPKPLCWSRCTSACPRWSRRGPSPPSATFWPHPRTVRGRSRAADTSTRPTSST
jgi:hypothetical protein